MLVVDKNFSRVKCFLKFLFELSGGFACAITERERIYHSEDGPPIKRVRSNFYIFYDDHFLILLLLNYYQILNCFGSLLSFEDIYSGFYSELKQVRQRGRLSDQWADPSLSG